MTALGNEKLELDQNLTEELTRNKELLTQLELETMEHKEATQQFKALKNELEMDKEKLQKELSHSGNEIMRLKQQLSLSQTTMDDINATLNETLLQRQALETQKNEWEVKYQELNRSTSIAINSFHSVRSDVEAKYQLEVDGLNQKVDAYERRLDETKHLLVSLQAKNECQQQEKLRLEQEYDPLN
jgi:chromosome segregation ATPase